ncbi:IclR family transcriptional regulator [Arthrobacter sp. MYb211]|uniref:IclR family transcriptional regulator n=1 Tax=Micrococcaceae TaxID=1268 RepID=UPI000CFD60AB|nr:MULTISPECIES: IclR family transcriptional regulator [unclassified Arthrobacter]PRA03007.1 IclR family transcriptional regulator [Arthrobacter sp. MYb229]PRA11030.1 IclR family transcriptional regulator [Arthrobacter sp. MYb221]PRB49477.1 IclR family transcriptional regulator [Arthrobacter sp. MYb216]PRC07185.1 IclR family transcriptional regulator [Arthrobacter sp. MYb211]
MSATLKRALGLLNLIATEPQSLDDIAADSQVHKTTIMRQLHTLEECRFVVRNDQGKYQLGSKLFELSSLALEQRNIVQVAHPHLTALNRLTGQTIHLAAFEGPEVVYIDKLESRHSVRMYSRIGLTASLHATAVAKVLLSELPVERRQHIAESLNYHRYTKHTLSNAEDFLTALDTVERQGFAFDNREHEEFVHCVAVPIRDASSHVVAAVSCSVPVVLLSQEELLALVPEIKSVAEAISADLGFIPTERKTL